MIVKYCLEALIKKQVLIKDVIQDPFDDKKYTIYCKTDQLNAICPKINNIHLPVIEKILEEHRGSNRSV
jgi:hypothetical protein